MQLDPLVVTRGPLGQGGGHQGVGVETLVPLCMLGTDQDRVRATCVTPTESNGEVSVCCGLQIGISGSIGRKFIHATKYPSQCRHGTL